MNFCGWNSLKTFLFVDFLYIKFIKIIFMWNSLKKLLFMNFLILISFMKFLIYGKFADVQLCR